MALALGFIIIALVIIICQKVSLLIFIAPRTSFELHFIFFAFVFIPEYNKNLPSFKFLKLISPLFRSIKYLLNRSTVTLNHTEDKTPFPPLVVAFLQLSCDEYLVKENSKKDFIEISFSFYDLFNTLVVYLYYVLRKIMKRIFA